VGVCGCVCGLVLVCVCACGFVGGWVCVGFDVYLCVSV
jgi:hypothetical protein